MTGNLNIFISADYHYDISRIRNILESRNIMINKDYDIQIGDSIQRTIKNQIKNADFGLFLITQDSLNSIYEMGICEGLNKEYFVLIDKNLNPPQFLKNRLFIRVDISDFSTVEEGILKIASDIEKRQFKSKSQKRRPNIKSENYPENIKDELRNLLPLIKNLRTARNNQLLENKVFEIFKSIDLNVIENDRNKDKGVDFALWNDKLGKLIGNPIIIEVKQGNIATRRSEIQKQLMDYSRKSDAKVAILLYLDENNKRIQLESSLEPLIFSYDIEDFINALLENPFENILLSERNKIVHS